MLEQEATVCIVMDSERAFKKMSGAAAQFEGLGIGCDVSIISARRAPAKHATKWRNDSSRQSTKVRRASLFQRGLIEAYPFPPLFPNPSIFHQEL